MLDENSTFVTEVAKPSPRNPHKCDPYRKHEKVNLSLDRAADIKLDESRFKLDDEDTYYEYGPKPKPERYRFKENFVQLSDRAKIKLYTRKEDPLSSAHPFN